MSAAFQVGFPPARRLGEAGLLWGKGGLPHWRKDGSAGLAAL